jgi:ketosteroid isomerase-like protein
LLLENTIFIPMMLRFLVTVGLAAFVADAARIAETGRHKMQAGDQEGEEFWGGFWNWWGRHEPVQASWDNHFAAFGAQDVERILQDYTEDSVITVHSQATGGNFEFRGLAGVRSCFEGLFANLYDTSDLAAPVITVNEASDHEPGSVFLIWKAPASGYSEATDTFIFDTNAKILRQNVVFQYVDPRRETPMDRLDHTEAPTGSGAVHDGWANHFAAFGGQDVDRILLDYVEESEITVYNQADGSQTIFKGLAGVRNCFTGLFASLHDTSDLAAPIIHVEESVNDEAGSVFLIWSAAASGYIRATDTFIFNAKGKITRQHVVVHYAPVQRSWDNHFAAFGGQDVERILLDYTEESRVTVYNQLTGDNTVYEGLAGVRSCFEGLFASLYDTSDLAAPVITVTEATAHEPGSVFLIWRAPASGYSEATDTFLMDSNSKILFQNVVVSYQDPRADGPAEMVNDSEAPTGSGPVHAGWENHFAAFGGQDVDRILLDYVEDSVITVYNQADGTSTTYKGLAGVRECFTGLFASLFDTSDLAAPIIHVEESDDGEAGEVFLIWSAGASGYVHATDTFLFNAAGKITRQHVVVHYEPVGAAWNNHFAAFGGQDVARVLQDYTDNSVITVYNQATGANTVYRGLVGVRECFEGLFASLYDTSDLAAPVITVNEATSHEPGSVLLIWRAPASGYSECTDTFIFDSDSKILFQNVVVVYRDPRATGPPEMVNDAVAPTGSGPVHAGWANHFAAFGGQDVDMILLDYVEESEITVYNHNDGSSTIYQGLDGVRRCFTGLFASLSDTSDLAAPIIEVVEAADGEAGQVFLIWSAAASGYQRATDTFIFNSAGKITRQHVVVHQVPDGFQGSR